MAKADHIIHLENGRLASDTPRIKVSQIAQNAVSQGHLVIHFHGGLVSYDSAMEIVERLLDDYLDANSYPVFYVWESGLLETLKNNFSEIAGERFFRMLWKKISAIVKRKFGQTEGQRAAFSLPQADTTELDASIDLALDREDVDYLTGTEDEPEEDIEELSDYERLMLENELRMDAELYMEVQKISNGLRNPVEVTAEFSDRSAEVRGSSETLMDPRALDQLIDRPAPGHRGIISSAKAAKAIVTIAARVVSRFVKKRHHGFHATVVEEILRGFYLANVGEFIWNNMKKDTADSFGDDGDIFGGTALLDSLRDAIDPATPPRITLIGHSTGAVYIAHFLDKAKVLLGDEQKFGVIFLAPASNAELTAGMLNRHQSRIENFRMFTMTDHYEKNDVLLKTRLLYPHSLLYFVSGVVEGGHDVPLTGMARFFREDHFPGSRFPAVKVIRDYLADDSRRVVWAVSDDGPEGHRSKSEHHGDFDNDETNRQSVMHILKTGF